MEIIGLVEKARRDMQTKLRMIGIVSLAFVAGLLWTSTLAAAPAPKKLVFGGKPQYVGIASWYGKQHQGLTMANGKPFDRRKLTAAAWNIPLGTVVRVVNLKNGNAVNVTITDRGPHPRLSRAIDLSEAAAIKLDYIKKGLTPVFIIPVAKGQFESAKIMAQLIEPEVDAPVFAEQQTVKPVIVSVALLTDGADQSR
jgi:rare lipoprotein A (peptidoglycan hydrolase)